MAATRVRKSASASNDLISACPKKLALEEWIVMWVGLSQMAPTDQLSPDALPSSKGIARSKRAAALRKVHLQFEQTYESIVATTRDCVRAHLILHDYYVCFKIMERPQVKSILAMAWAKTQDMVLEGRLWTPEAGAAMHKSPNMEPFSIIMVRNADEMEGLLGALGSTDAPPFTLSTCPDGVTLACDDASFIATLASSVCGTPTLPQEHRAPPPKEAPVVPGSGRGMKRHRQRGPATEVSERKSMLAQRKRWMSDFVHALLERLRVLPTHYRDEIGCDDRGRVVFEGKDNRVCYTFADVCKSMDYEQSVLVGGIEMAIMHTTMCHILIKRQDPQSCNTKIAHERGAHGPVMTDVALARVLNPSTFRSMVPILSSALKGAWLCSHVVTVLNWLNDAKQTALCDRLYGIWDRAKALVHQETLGGPFQVCLKAHHISRAVSEHMRAEIAQRFWIRTQSLVPAVDIPSSNGREANDGDDDRDSVRTRILSVLAGSPSLL